MAKDGGSPPRHTEHSVIVQILDANDQIPTFLSSNYSYSIPEGSPFGSLLGRVQATDTDTGTINVPPCVPWDHLCPMVTESRCCRFRRNSAVFIGWR